ncbi:MAG: hypothetical protein ACLFQE_04275 [Thermotogota bacterium]
MLCCTYSHDAFARVRRQLSCYSDPSSSIQIDELYKSEKIQNFEHAYFIIQNNVSKHNGKERNTHLEARVLNDY